MKENASKVSKVKKRFTVFMNKHAFLRNMIQVYAMSTVGFILISFGMWLTIGLLKRIGGWALLLGYAYVGLLITGRHIIERIKYNQQVLPLIRVAEEVERGES